MTNAPHVDGRVGRRIRRRRLELGLSQRACSSPGVSYAYLSRVEAGTRVPSAKALIQLAERLDVTPLWLATGRETGYCPYCLRR
jgi:transcriptional regulator with XRE-family HTH domain